jgi:hypothetical protein
MLAQTSSESIQEKYYNFCRTDLKKLKKIREYAFFDTNQLCSIKRCFRNIGYDPINKVIYKRVVELAKKNYRDGIYLYLIEGPNSKERADVLNKNITDDKNLIYVSVDDFIDHQSISHAKDLYNSKMKRLISKN